MLLRNGDTSIGPIDNHFSLGEIPSVFLAEELVVVTNAQGLAFALTVFSRELMDQTIRFADSVVALDSDFTLSVHVQCDREGIEDC